MRWIRFSGVVGFALISALIAAVLFIAMGPLIKLGIERVGSEMAGAKVDVSDVDFSVAPLGVTLHQVSVADAEHPMRNVFEFDQAQASLQLGPLLLGKSIVDTLVVDRLVFDTERTTSGALPSKGKEGQQGETDSDSTDGKPDNTLDLKGKVPTAQELLAREPLKTDAAARATQEAIQVHQAKVTVALKDLPDDAALAEYKAAIEAITGGDIQSLEDFQRRKQELQALKQRMAKDKRAIEQARDTVNLARQEVAHELSVLKSAPADDIAMLRSKYSLNSGGAANLASLLLGEEVGEWAHQAAYWYEKLQPYLNGDTAPSETPQGEAPSDEVKPTRAQGRFVPFPTDDPWPDFLIRQVSISAPVDAGGFLRVRGWDITHQQAILQRPMRFTLTSENLSTIDSLTLNATLDHRQHPSQDTLTLDMKGYDLQDVSLAPAKTTLARAQMSLIGEAVVKGGDQLEAQADAVVNDAQFNSVGGDSLAQEMGQALSQIHQLTIQATATGKMIAPSITVASDLDEQLAQVMKGRLNEKQREIESQIKQQLDDKVAKSLGEYSEGLAEWDSADQSLGDRLATLEDLAQRQLADFAQQQKDKAKQKAKEALGNKLKGLI